MSDIYSNLASDYLDQFNQSLSVPAMDKIDQFPFLQNLNYAGQIGFIKKDFLGLADWMALMTTYSAANLILTSAWATIKATANLNSQVALQTYIDPDLGTVGLLFQSIPNYAQVFSLSQDDLSNTDSIDSKVTVSEDQSDNLQGS